MGDTWASTELRERTLELVTNTLNVKHPSLVSIGTGPTELKGNTLTSFSQNTQKALRSLQHPHSDSGAFGKVAKVRETNNLRAGVTQTSEISQVITTKLRKSRYFNSLTYSREL